MRKQKQVPGYKLLKLLFFISAALFVAPAAGAPDLRVGVATTVGNFNDLVYQHATMAFPATHSRGWRPDAWTVGVGTFQRNDDISSVYTFGPAWRFDGARGYFIDAAFSVAYLGHHRFRDGNHVDDFGQHLQFVSQLSLGFHLDRAQNWSVEAGFMHISNGGLSETNPGADFFSVDMQFLY